jgi:phage FluMu protein Com
MKKSYESILNKKEVRCRHCNKLVNFVETEKEYINCKSRPTMWGFSLICPKCDFEGEIKHCYVGMAGGGIMNMQDFIQDCTSIFEDNVEDKIIFKELEYQLKDR